MKLISPKFEILEQAPGLEGIEKQIELAGRTCYHSQNRITEDSAKKFVDMMVKSGHGAMLEHGTVYLKFSEFLIRSPKQECFYVLGKYKNNKYSKYNEVTITSEKGTIVTAYVTSNYRVLIEEGWLDDLKYICEPTEYHEKRVCVRFTCDRGVTHEFVRHRVFSFAQESTRYCNYSKDKFGNEITFIMPSWLSKHSIDSYNNPLGDIFVGEGEDLASLRFINAMHHAEYCYLECLKNGWTPQQARAVLPNALKAELVMTGFVSDWENFFKLRDDKAHAHPQAYELAHPLHEEFIKRGYIYENK